MEKFKKIGIMGGTFDPIHYGHLVLAEQVRCSLNLDCIYFLPTGDLSHKEGNEITNKKLRYEMVLLATVDNPNFRISDIEIIKNKPIYTVDTIRELKKELDINDKIYFITGADQILQIDTWKSYEELLKEIIFIGASRPGYDEKEVIEKVEHLKNTYSANILHIKVPALAISSTDIRDRVKNNDSIKYLLPKSVEQFIIKNNLYK